LIKRIEKILPSFCWLPIFTAVALNMIIYFIVPFFLPSNLNRYDFSNAIDYALPFVPFFLLFYILAYVQWVGSYIYHCRESVRLCYRITTADVIAKLICLFCFVFIPTQIVRPEITGNGLFELGTKFIYLVDKPINLFPSIHCLESWICFRGALMMKKKNIFYIIFQGIFTLLVFASTVLIKQHFVIDIPAGILAVEIGFLVSDGFKAWRLMDKIQPRFVKKTLNENF